jgi:hypothetical protein
MGLLLLAGLLLISGQEGAVPSSPPSVAASEAPSREALALADAFFVIGMRKATAPGGALDTLQRPAGAPPEWGPLMRQAMLQEIATKRAAITTAIAGRMAQRFTRAELKAGAVLTGDPAGRALIERAGDRSGAMNISEQDFLRRWAAMPGASAFARKLKSLEPNDVMDPATLTTELTPGVMTRMGALLQSSAAATTQPRAPTPTP